MAIKGMRLDVVDNSGAQTAEVIGIPGNTWQRTIKIGQLVKLAVKTALPVGQGKVSKGEHKDFFGIVVSLRNPIRRKNGTIVQSDRNGAILVSRNAKGELSAIGTRVLGTVAHEIVDMYPDVSILANAKDRY